MAHKASDGSAFTNMDAMKSHEAKLSARKPAAVAEAEPDGDDGGESAEQVASQHGPANEVHVMHNHAMGRHSVHSKHADGHTHQSEHGSAEEAHDHAKGLACGGGDMGGMMGDGGE